MLRSYTVHGPGASVQQLGLGNETFMTNRISWLLILSCVLPAAAFGQYAIITTSLPVATVGQSYGAAIQTNSTAPVTACTIVSGALPSGIGLQPSGSGCIVFGTPTVAVTTS